MKLCIYSKNTMSNLHEYKNRFKSLSKNKLGNVKPLLVEDDSATEISSGRRDEKEIDITKKLDNIFFGRDEMNISSEEGEFGYLSGEHRLGKKISPRQRMKRIQNVIDQLKDYIVYLEDTKSGEETYTKNPSYGDVWKGYEED